MSTAWTFDGHRFTELELATRRALRWAAWRPDGRIALLAGNGGSAVLFDGRRLQEVSTGTRQNLRGAAWAPDGSRALLAGNRGCVLLLQGEEVREAAPVSAENLRRVAWHPSGANALIVGNAGTVLRYEAATGELAQLPGDRAHTLRSLAWRPDGAYALVGAYASRWAGYPRPHAVYRCDGRFLQAALSTDDEDDIVSVDWTQDGLALLCGYARRPDSMVDKVLLYDGSGWRSKVWRSEQAVLGGGWRPGGGDALLVGESGLALRLTRDLALDPIESGLDANLTGPFWRPDGGLALVLKGPDENVYTV
jgi:hypothetical protein